MSVRAIPLPAEVEVAVVGAGTMGAGIAQVAAVAGHRVRLCDTRAGAAQAAVAEIAGSLARLGAKGRLSAAEAALAAGRCLAVDTLAGLAGCGLVVEAIVEDLEPKRTLFRSLEEVLGEDVLLATNTSSISVTAIGSALRFPGRLLGMHFFNPAPLMPLVEIISGAASSPAAASTLHATAIRWGKTPVYARSTPGFIVNRVARPFYAEALRVLSEGAASAATIDALLREAGGFRMGPFELMDLIGQDVNYAVTCSVFEAFYYDRRYTPSLLQGELVEAGFLGRKTGRGFFRYGEGAPPVVPDTLPPGALPASATLYGESRLALALAQRLADRGVALDRQAAHADGRIAEGDGFTLFESDGRTALARAYGTGPRNLVLVDLALDPATATRLGIAVADGSDPGALREAAALLQAAGYAVSAVDDVPGMIVLRTVAMLANEAADAVHQGVCSAEDCDLAMRKGVNYPGGPLGWADALGIGTIVRALEHLEQAYGEDRYRVSPLLRRKALNGTRFAVTKVN